ncbi:unnamed protein product [Agarophyton chilense]
MIVSNLEAPRLQSVTVRNFASFQKKRELYEKQVEENNREPGVDITPLSYEASIENYLLQIFLTAEWIKAADIKDITEEQLKSCIQTRASFNPDGNDLTRIEYVIRKVQMDMNLKEAEDRVWNLHHRYITALESEGMKELPAEKPHISIQHILKRIKPSRLRNIMKNIVRWRKEERFERKDFGVFMRELAAQAKKLDVELERDGVPKSEDEKDSDSSHSSTIQADRKQGKGGKRKSHEKSRKRRRERTGEQGDSDKQGRKKKPNRDLPPCLNPECAEFLFIADCNNSTEEEKEKFRKEYYAEKKKRREEATSGRHGKKKGKVNRVASERIDSHSSLFSALFCNGAVETVVLADQGSDVNLLPKSIFQGITEAAPVVKAEELVPSRVYSGISTGSPKQAEIECTERVSLDVQLRIRHGSKLLLRSLEWEIANADLDYVIIGRPVLQSIGCDNKAIIAAACDKNNGEINIPDALETDAKNRRAQEKGTIASIMKSGMYHSTAAEGDDGLEDTKVYIDLGEDDPQVLEDTLKTRVQEAKQNGMSAQGVQELADLLHEFKSVFD